MGQALPMTVWGILLAVNASDCFAAAVAPALDATQTCQAFDMNVPQAPTVAQIGPNRVLVYELHLTNFARLPLTLKAVTIIDDTSGSVIHSLDGDVLDAVIGGPGIDGVGLARRMVGTGRRAVVYLEVALGNATPARLRHQVEFGVNAHAGVKAAAALGALTPVRSGPVPLLGPPLRGGPWVAVYDPALENGHRRYIYAVGGRARIPGRFAIDWMRPGRFEVGSADDGRGAPVLAVEDAVVAATRDEVAEIPPGAPRPPVKLQDATGNYVALDIGEGRYAFYEHLAPGLMVKIGDQVRRGQIIGRLGSTGQASRPHLHFHVADANAPVASEGQPYLLAGGRTLGSYPSITAFEAGGPWQPLSRANIGPALPTPNAVMRFDD
jgi:murein DD-endopeptidase